MYRDLNSGMAIPIEWDDDDEPTQDFLKDSSGSEYAIGSEAEDRVCNDNGPKSGERDMPYRITENIGTTREVVQRNMESSIVVLRNGSSHSEFAVNRIFINLAELLQFNGKTGWAVIKALASHCMKKTVISNEMAQYARAYGLMFENEVPEYVHNVILSSYEESTDGKNLRLVSPRA
jgi:hypothetical protein